MSCIIGGTPTPDIKWTKNQKTFETTTMIYENRVAKYTIDETTEETAATYSCIATNEIGKADTSCKVIVQEKPLITIQENLITQKLRKSTHWKVIANISGLPKPDVYWYKKDTKLISNNKCTITYENNVSIITIESVERSDSDKYTIEAKNTAGTCTVDVTLKVIGKNKMFNYYYIIIIICMIECNFISQM